MNISREASAMHKGGNSPDPNESSDVPNGPGDERRFDPEYDGVHRSDEELLDTSYTDKVQHDHAYLDRASSDGFALDPSRMLAHDSLGAKVLVLNKAYVAMRIISARRAFCLLARNHAEVIHVDSVTDDGAINGAFLNYDFATWAELSVLQRQFEPERFDWVRTPRIDIAVPRIIRLLVYERLPDQVVKLNRRNLFARDRNLCQYCGRHFPTNDLSIDHVKPRAHGCQDTWENLVCACIRCNARKGGRTPEQASMRLIKVPVRRKRTPLISIRLRNDKYRTWKAFLDHAYWDVELR